MTAHPKGQLRLRIMGDLLRNPGTRQAEMRRRLEIADEATTRITLNRLMDSGFVRRVGPGFMLSRAGIEELATIRQWVSP